MDGREAFADFGLKELKSRRWGPGQANIEMGERVRRKLGSVSPFWGASRNRRTMADPEEREPTAHTGPSSRSGSRAQRPPRTLPIRPEPAISPSSTMPRGPKGRGRGGRGSRQRPASAPTKRSIRGGPSGCGTWCVLISLPFISPSPLTSDGGSMEQVEFTRIALETLLERVEAQEVEDAKPGNKGPKVKL